MRSRRSCFLHVISTLFGTYPLTEHSSMLILLSRSTVHVIKTNFTFVCAEITRKSRKSRIGLNGRCLFELHRSTLNQSLSAIKSVLRELRYYNRVQLSHNPNAFREKKTAGEISELKKRQRLAHKSKKHQTHFLFPGKRRVVKSFKSHFHATRTFVRGTKQIHLKTQRVLILKRTSLKNEICAPKMVVDKKSLNQYDSHNQEILTYLTTFRPQGLNVLEVFNFLRENGKQENCNRGNFSGRKKKRAYSSRDICFTDTSLDGYTTKGRRETNTDTRSNSSVQPQISTLLTYDGSSPDDFIENKSDSSFAGMEHVWDSDRKYSINRFNYTGEVYDEILKRMSNEESDMHIKDNTKVGTNQFLTYQIIIKTNDSIYFIKPKDKKCFLLNKSSVSEMVAPTTTVNSAGDKINVAKFAFVELENGSTLNSQSGTSKNCEDTLGSRNFFSSAETDTCNRFTLNTGSYSEQSSSIESQPCVQRSKRNPDASKVMTKSSRRVIHQLEKMRFVTYNRPYHFCDIVFYSTALPCHSDQALQNEYFTFLKDKIKNKLYALPNQNKIMKNSSGDQNTENKNVILTAEYVDRFWERNKLKECDFLFDLEPEFYSKTFPLKLNVNSKSKDCDKSARLSDIMSRPSKHDSLLSTLLDLKLRDIMSYIWKSSSKTKLPSISSSQIISEMTCEKLQWGLLKPNKKSAEFSETTDVPQSKNESYVLQVDHDVNEKPLPEIKIKDQVKYLIELNKKSSTTSSEANIVMNAGHSNSLESCQNNILEDSFENKHASNAEPITTASMCINTQSTDMSENIFYGGESLENLTLLHKEIEEGNNKCVLALATNEGAQESKTAVINEKKPVRRKKSLNIVQESNEELHILISTIDLTSSTSRKGDSSKFKLDSSSTAVGKRSNINIKSQATLSISSGSYIEKRKGSKKNSKIGLTSNIEPIYSNVWRKQQLTHESMLERVIPEDSILSICARSDHSVTNSASPTYTSRTSSSQNTDKSSLDRSLVTDRMYTQSENDGLTSCCNLSVLAVVPSRCAQYSENYNQNSSRRKSKHSRKSSAYCEGKIVARSNLTMATKSNSHFNMIKSQDALAGGNISGLRQLRKRKSNIEAVKKLGDKVSNNFRRALPIQGFRSERSQKKDKAQCIYKRRSGARVLQHSSTHGDEVEHADSQRWILNRRPHVSEDKFPKITCDYDNVPLPHSERSLVVPMDASITSIASKKTHKKRAWKQKYFNSSAVTLNNHEGDIAQNNKKLLKKKSKLRKRFEKKEDEKGTLIANLKLDSNYSNRRVLKNFKFNEKCVGRHFRRGDFPVGLPRSRRGSESSLSSYKTVNSYLLYDGMKSCKQESESDFTNGTTKKSAIQTFIGPSAIDGMMNIINLFYARKPDECSC